MPHPLSPPPDELAPAKVPGSPPAEEYKFYTDPLNNICLNDEKGDVMLTSSDGHMWFVQARQLRAASEFFNDILDDEMARRSSIPLGHPAKEVHPFLYYITRHTLSGHNTLQRRLDPSRGEKSTLLALYKPQIQQHIDDLVVAMTMLDKFQCLNHIDAANLHAHALLTMIAPEKASLGGGPNDPDIQNLMAVAVKYDWTRVVRLGLRRLKKGWVWSEIYKDNDFFGLFIYASQYNYPTLARSVIAKFGTYQMRDDEGQVIEEDGRPVNFHPSNWTEERLEEIGIPVFLAFGKACRMFTAEGPKDWEVVAGGFELP